MIVLLESFENLKKRVDHPCCILISRHDIFRILQLLFSNIVAHKLFIVTNLSSNIYLYSMFIEYLNVDVIYVNLVKLKYA